MTESSILQNSTDYVDSIHFNKEKLECLIKVNEVAQR